MRSLFAVVLAASLAMAAVATLRFAALTLLLPVVVSGNLCRRTIVRRGARSPLGTVLLLVFDVTFLLGLGVLVGLSAGTGK